MDREQLAGHVEDWVEELWSDDKPGSPLDYLVAERGLTTDTIERYLLGYTAGGLEHRYANCISIPTLTGTSTLRGVRFRRLGDGKPKYDALKERQHLFNVGSVKHHKVYLTEGEFDAIVLEQLGFPAVGVPGASSFKDEWRYLFIGNEVYIVFDPDEEGERGARKVLQLLRPIAENVTVVKLPAPHDVTSLYLADPEHLLEVIEGYD